MQILSNTLALIVVLSVLVVVHEFGHFAVAKAFGFPVEVFSVGFGKRLFGRKWRGTDYRVSAIPLGGYVRVIGLGPDESTLTDGTSREAAPVGKRWQRALILLAGPGMNLALAILLHSLVFAVGVRVPAYELSPAVVGVVSEGSPASEKGIAVGDRIVSIDGTETPRWRDAEYLIAVHARTPLDLVIDRNGARRSVTVTPRAVGKYDYGDIGVFPDVGRNVRGRIGTVVPGSAAAAAGLKRGDVILSVGGADIRGGPTEMQDKFIAAVQAGAGKPLTIRCERDGREVETVVQPRKEGEVWRVGVQIGPDVPEVLQRFPVGQAFVEGWRQVRTEFRLTLSILGRLFRGAASMKSMSGPLDIAKFSGEAARTGAIPLVALMAAISLQLGIFNLLPIPVLDGGHLFLLGVEGIARRDFSLRVKERILQVGFVMILALLVVVLYNDLSKNLPAGWWPF
ncbi:MAG TPA: RIP metalloprotease RseP [Thermoanaerobaculia bacterium]